MRRVGCSWTTGLLTLGAFPVNGSARRAHVEGRYPADFFTPSLFLRFVLAGDGTLMDASQTLLGHDLVGSPSVFLLGAWDEHRRTGIHGMVRGGLQRVLHGGQYRNPWGGRLLRGGKLSRISSSTSSLDFPERIFQGCPSVAPVGRHFAVL